MTLSSHSRATVSGGPVGSAFTVLKGIFGVCSERLDKRCLTEVVLGRNVRQEGVAHRYAVRYEHDGCRITTKYHRGERVDLKQRDSHRGAHGGSHRRNGRRP